jgi:hypothetical protein
VAGEVDFDIEAADSADDAASGDSVVVGSDRHHELPFLRRLDAQIRIPTKVLLVGLIAALAIAIGVSVTFLATRSHPTAQADAHPPVLNDQEIALSAMVDAAQSSVPLRSYSVEDNSRPNCRPGAADQPDLAAMMADVVHEYVADFVRYDSATIIELSGTCSVQVRLKTGDDATMLVTVLPPPNTVTPYFISVGDDTSTAVQSVANADGWRVEVGAVGKTGTLPDARELALIANDPRMRW